MTSKEYKTITDIKGPLVFLEKTEPVAYGEIVSIRLSDGSEKNGQILDTSDDMVVVQVFEGTEAIDRKAGVKFLGDVFKLPVSKGPNRPYSRWGRSTGWWPRDHRRRKRRHNWSSDQPYSRQSPHDFIQTGVSAIDCCTTLVRGQKLQSSARLDSRTMTSHCRLPDRQSSETAMKSSLWFSAPWE